MTYYSFVEEALNIANYASIGIYQDPFLFQGGTYEWRAHGSLGENFKRLRRMVGNTFYTLKKSYL
jgi:hypothetical protein